MRGISQKGDHVMLNNSDKFMNEINSNMRRIGLIKREINTIQSGLIENLDRNEWHAIRETVIHPCII